MTSSQDQPRRRRRRGTRATAGPAASTGQPAAPGSVSAATEADSGAGPASSAAGATSGAAGSSGPASGKPSGSEPTERRRSEPNGGRRDDAGRGHGRDSERGWRDLAGSSPSQVGLSGALRARDVARPTPEDLAAAERSVVVVRRQWQPPEG